MQTVKKCVLPLKAISVMALKVPLQNTTVRGPIHNKEKARSRTDCVVLRADMKMVVMF